MTSGVRDPEGPDHKPRLDFHSKIEGVVLQQAPFVNYPVGNVLTELYRPEWPGIFGPGEKIEHLYTVWAGEGGIRKEWYFHEHTLDRYMLLVGELSVGLYDGRENSSSHGIFEVQRLVAQDPTAPDGIRIAPGVWHSLKWESKQGMFLNAKLPGYRRDLPDKFRIPMADLPPAISWNTEEN